MCVCVSEGGQPFLIDSVNRSAGYVNDWTIPFPRSVGASGNAMPRADMIDSNGVKGPGWGLWLRVCSGWEGKGVMKRRQVRQTHLHPQRKRRRFPASADAYAPPPFQERQKKNFVEGQ
uniref:Uncharacterized protein n=1 Tax=Knipowitschia caucasica TaxID=637954 RepID=A0AAV2MRI7_KNICA